jgi:hypothetical protein
MILIAGQPPIALKALFVTEVIVDRDDHERSASHAGRGRPCRVMEQDAEDRGQGHGRRGVPAREGQLTEMRPVDEVLEHRGGRALR